MLRLWSEIWSILWLPQKCWLRCSHWHGLVTEGHEFRIQSNFCAVWWLLPNSGLSGLVNRYELSGRIFFLHLHFSTLKMEAVRSFETLITFCEIARCDIPGGSNLYIHRSENFRSIALDILISIRRKKIFVTIMFLLKLQMQNKCQ
jgi:hypothetical protein